MPAQDPVLYAVCDGEKARFLRFDGQQMRTFQRFGAHDSETDAIGEVGSIKQPRTDPHVQVKERFAREIAGEIENVLKDNAALEGFVLTAPPHVLHDIREQFSKATLKKLIKTETKDLTNIPDQDLLPHFDRPATGWPQLTP
ncbi:host attachment protein [Kozakia baliensis]|uniref:host attachment protein n=1 Tax=Kozakia baliensis TaxID=153496 RepID=UPI00345C5708